MPTWGKIVFLVLSFAGVLAGSWLLLRFVII
jgi:hypothetical protein